MFALASLNDKFHLGNLQAFFGDKTASLINIETGKKECLCLKTFSRHARRSPILPVIREVEKRKTQRHRAIARLCREQEIAHLFGHGSLGALAAAELWPVRVHLACRARSDRRGAQLERSH